MQYRKANASQEQLGQQHPTTSPHAIPSNNIVLPLTVIAKTTTSDSATTYNTIKQWCIPLNYNCDNEISFKMNWETIKNEIQPPKNIDDWKRPNSKDRQPQSAIKTKQTREATFFFGLCHRYKKVRSMSLGGSRWTTRDPLRNIMGISILHPLYGSFGSIKSAMK